MPKGLKGFQKGHKAFSIRGRFTSKQMIGNTNGFKKGNKPWNYVDGLGKIRKRKIKYNKPYSHFIWCEYNNIHKVPNKCVIHHLDLNPMNNNPQNLQLLSLTSHNDFHNYIFKLRRDLS